MDASRAGDGRQRLIEATLDRLAEHGNRGLSLRKIASAAGVTAPLVTHHFARKDQLLLAAYRHFRAHARSMYLAAAERAEPDPVQRLAAFVGQLLQNNFANNRQRMKIWVGFLDLVLADPEMAALQAESIDLYLEEFSRTVTRIYAERGEALSAEEAYRHALGINAVLDGLWLECSLNPSRMTQEEALRVALDMIGKRIGVSYSNPPGAT